MCIQKLVRPADGPHPAKGQLGHEEKLREVVFAAQEVAWTAVSKSLSKELNEIL